MTPRRMIWFIDGTAWRIDRVADRWELRRWLTSTEEWLRVGDFSSRMAAIEAAYGEEDE